MKLIIKDHYEANLNLVETEIAIKYIKDNFERDFAKAMKLTRVSAPLFVTMASGLNDHLNGYERAVNFDVPALGEHVEIVQSLAKWKRTALKTYEFSSGYGIYTDMNAIRRDEELDNLHSIYVDQWDWEKIIDKNDRSLNFLKKTVKDIYRVICKTEQKLYSKYPDLVPVLPKEITFISSSKLEKMYPNLDEKARENMICKEKKAVFIYQIGWPLKNGHPHDGRAADYDDWNLNGDILVWYDLLGIAFELSSMGIRVDEESLPKQLAYKNELANIDTPYVQAILHNELPLTIGGGIGQSRLCMFFLRKMHIGEVQSSLWNEQDLILLRSKNVNIL